MSKVHASKRTRHVSPATFSIKPHCLFCGSVRVCFCTGHDDWGAYVTVKCCRCEAEGPHVRAMIWEGTTTTDEMKQEAATAWTSVWDQVACPPATILVDSDCKEIARPARKPRARRVPKPIAPPPAARYFSCKCTGTKHGELTGCSGTGAEVTSGLCAFCVAGCRTREAAHEVQHVPAPKTNGHNGHHTGSVL
jgi:hypothetical protein